MVAGQNGTIMEVAVKLAEVEVNSAQEVVITLHHRTMERTVQGRHPNLENVIHKDAQSMVVGRNGVVTEVAVSLVEVEDKPEQEAVLTPHQRTMVKLAPDLLLNPELVIHKDARSMEVGRNGVAMEVAVALAEVEVKPVLEAVLTLHQRTMERHVQDPLLNPEHAMQEHVQPQVIAPIKIILCSDNCYYFKNEIQFQDFHESIL